uniref:Uncharacterized protein n=1 Tax=Panagrolaimus davidi TaxID=227884 RepID=A0A914P778_9BILA
MTISAEMELFKNLNSTTIYITNVSVSGDLIYGPPQSVCANVQGEQVIPPSGSCSTSLTTPFNFSTQDPSITLQIFFPKDYYIFDFYFGFIDDGTFSYKDGTLFTPENSTILETDNDLDISFFYNDTCTSFIPAPIAPTNSSKCKTFKSQILILNTNDSYSIYASSYMTWNLNGNSLEATGNYTTPGRYFFEYIFNDDNYECVGSGCSYTLKSGDKKLIISAALERYAGFDLIVNPIPMVGRIIFRGNQILMKEGIPFSPKNDCLYFNFPYSGYQVSTNKFCCIEFE